MNKILASSLLIGSIISGFAQKSDKDILKEIKENRPSKRKELPADFNVRIGTALAGAKYYFTEEPIVIEGTKKTKEYWSKQEGKDYQALNSLKTTDVTVKQLSDANGNLVYEVSNTSDVPALNIKLNAVNADSKEVILPAYFSNGYFTLLPNEKRVIVLDKRNLSATVNIRVSGYNVEEKIKL